MLHAQIETTFSCLSHFVLKTISQKHSCFTNDCMFSIVPAFQTDRRAAMPTGIRSSELCPYSPELKLSFVSLFCCVQYCSF